MADRTYGLGPADIKAALARVGQSPRPGSTMKIVPAPPSGTHAVIIVERVIQGVTPEYCVHGYASCVSCGEMCWLGDNSHKIVDGEQAYPLCIQCGAKLLPKVGITKPDHNVHDHLRSEGPH